LQPEGVIVLPGGHAGFAAGFGAACTGGGGLTAAAAAAGGRGGGGDGLTAAVVGVDGGDGGFGFTAVGGGVFLSGFASVFTGVGVPPFSVACPLSAGAFSFGVLAPFGFVPSVVWLVGFAPGWLEPGFTSLAATTPLPVNSPGFAVAAIAG
jgi:hypothetical protein